jgi:hypothetical protein
VRYYPAGMNEREKSNSEPEVSAEAQHFFLSAAGESADLAQPRECWEINRLQCGERDDYMLISIEPPLKMRHGIGYRDVYKVIVASRFKGQTLYPISAWPSHVFVMTYPDEIVSGKPEINPERIQIIAWAMLFRTLDEVDTHFNRFR